MTADAIPGARPDPLAPPDPVSLQIGYRPDVPTREGRYLVRTWDGRFQRGITLVRHSLGGFLMVPDAPAADCRPLNGIGPRDYLWLEVL